MVVFGEFDWHVIVAFKRCKIFDEQWRITLYNARKNNELLFFRNGNVFCCCFFVFDLVIVSINKCNSFAGSDDTIISFYSHKMSYFGQMFYKKSDKCQGILNGRYYSKL